MIPKAIPRLMSLSRHKATTLSYLFLLGLVFLSPISWRPPAVLAQNQSAARTQPLTLDFQNVAPGLEHAQTTVGLASKDVSTGPWFINVLRIDLKRATIKIVRALDAGVGLETVSSLAARHEAAAAINGGYFRTTGTYRGESLGLVLLGGNLISEPYNERADFGVLTQGKTTELVFGHLRYQSEISLGGRKHKVNGVNRPVARDELIVFSPEFHRTTLTKPDGIEVIIRRNRVVSISDLRGSSLVPADGLVVSASGLARDWIKNHARKGARAQLRWRLKAVDPNDDAKWARVQNILGAGPQLIKAGTIDITDKREKMVAGFATDRHPRTALARLQSEKLLLITVDGRQPGVSVGMSLQELAELLLKLGAVDAINLDGGGSTTMVVQNKIVNRPSDQTGERPVSDAVLVFPHRSENK